MDQETASKIDQFIEKLKAFQRAEQEFTFIIEDISGNSFVQNPFAPDEDPNTVIEHLTRSQEQNRKLGIYDDEMSAKENNGGEIQQVDEKEEG